MLPADLDEVPGEPVEFIPGPFEAPENAAFRKARRSGSALLSPAEPVSKRCQAYASMAEHSGITLPQALEKPRPRKSEVALSPLQFAVENHRRYHNCEKELADSEAETDAGLQERCKATVNLARCSCNTKAAKELAAELQQYGPGPAKDLSQGIQLVPGRKIQSAFANPATHLQAQQKGLSGSRTGWRGLESHSRLPLALKPFSCLALILAVQAKFRECSWGNG